ncbi:MAG: hypothetical protein ICV56_02275 [Nitrososphaeraceae archaeon]|nr:hypothetical protein [Nitrososphaeraceae archaeon]
MELQNTLGELDELIKKSWEVVDNLKTERKGIAKQYDRYCNAIIGDLNWLDLNY